MDRLGIFVSIEKKVVKYSMNPSVTSWFSLRCNELCCDALRCDSRDYGCPAAPVKMCFVFACVCFPLSCFSTFRLLHSFIWQKYFIFSPVLWWNSQTEYGSSICNLFIYSLQNEDIATTHQDLPENFRLQMSNVLFRNVWRIAYDGIKRFGAK